MMEISKWNGKKSVRIRVKGLWFVASWDLSKRLAAGFVYNGKRLGWQLQTWRPRLVFWKMGKRPVSTAWSHLFHLLPGAMLSCDVRPLNWLYLAVARRAANEEEMAIGAVRRAREKERTL